MCSALRWPRVLSQSAASRRYADVGSAPGRHGSLGRRLQRVSDLAGKMRTSRSAVSSLERGEKLPNVLTLEIAARSLNVPAWLVLQLAEVKVFKSVQF